MILGDAFQLPVIRPRVAMTSVLCTSASARFRGPVLILVRVLVLVPVLLQYQYNRTGLCRSPLHAQVHLHPHPRQYR